MNELTVYGDYEGYVNNLQTRIWNQTKNIASIIESIAEEQTEQRIRGWWYWGWRYSFIYDLYELRFNFDEYTEKLELYELRIRKPKQLINLEGKIKHTPEIFRNKVLAFRSRKKFKRNTKEELELEKIDYALNILRDVNYASLQLTDQRTNESQQDEVYGDARLYVKPKKKKRSQSESREY